MARNSYTFYTPLGSFASSAQAAAAHHCDKSTIAARCVSDPTNYRKVLREPRRLPGNWHTRREWPLSWNQYRGLDFETREQIFFDWCSAGGHDPDQDASADLFHDEMDRILDVVLEPELDKDLESELNAE